MGLFGNLFNLNGDGKVDALEEAMEFDFFMQTQREASAQDPTLDADDPFLNDEDQELLDATGYDRDELELMDASERSELLEDAGYEPMDFGFDDF